MDVYRGKIRVFGDLIIIDDEVVGDKVFDDWISDIYGGIQPKHKAIEVRLKEK